MGPRLFRRGNPSASPNNRRPPKASMGPRLFRRGNTVYDAASNTPYYLLQWGHVFSDVETWKSDCSREIVRQASMGPRLFRRGNNEPDQHNRNGSNSFNGATSFQTWKLGILDGYVWVQKASMGPRLFRRGNAGRITRIRQLARRLQWGHVFSDVETRTSRRVADPNDGLQWGHVFSDVETYHHR